MYVPVQFGLILSATIIAHDFGKRKSVREILVKNRRGMYYKKGEV